MSLMTKNNVETDRDYPDDLIFEILLRLPLKPVLRFRAASKYWSSLVSSTFFAKLHLKHSELDGKQKLFLSTRNGFKTLDCKECIDVTDTRRIEIPIKISKDFEILGSCNGLICISTGSCKTIVIQNPLTNESVRLPLLRYKSNSFVTRYGFGYDPKTDDYKVFVLSITDINANTENTQPELNLFSMRKGSWKNIKDTKKLNSSGLDAHRFGRGAVYLDGALHWMDGLGGDLFNERGVSIVSLNLKNETFKRTPLPQSNHYQFPTLGVLYNFLFISATVPGYLTPANIDNADIEDTSSWFVRWYREDSPSNVVFVAAASDDHPCTNSMWRSVPLSFCTRNGIILCYRHGLATVKGPTNNITLFHYGHSFKATVYTESLISLRGICGVEDKRKRKRECSKNDGWRIGPGFA